MGIENPMFGTRSVSETPLAVIEMVTTKPPLRTLLTPREDGNKMVGYYNPERGAVELFITSPNGDYWLRVTG